MRVVQTGLLAGPIALLVLLGVLSETVGLSGTGWLVGTAGAVVTCLALAAGLTHHHAEALGPANRVTLSRAMLVCGVAALTASSFSRPAPMATMATLVTLAAVALVLDAVDGWLARRTGTVSAVGARFDMEVDAFLILVLSVYVARSAGAWVLAIGAARYVFVAARWALPWMQGTVPPRHWCKVVAAVQGIVLTVVAADLLPRSWEYAVLAASLVLLAESFGRETWWLWRHRSGAPASRLVTVLACALVWAALVVPSQVGELSPAAFVRIPLEGLVVVALALVLPPRASRTSATLVGVVLGVLVLVRVLDVGFSEVLDRPFDPVNDWVYLGPAFGVLGDSIGEAGAVASAVAAGALVIVLVVVMPLAVLRLSRVVHRHRRTSLRAVTALGVVWVLGAVSGLQLAPGAHLASTSAAALAHDEVRLVRAGIADRRTFAKAVSVDDYGETPSDQLLTGLRGKDVLLVFIESYGRVAVQDSSFAPGVQAVLDSGTKRLRAAGFSSRSAFLTSPTFGAASWLAHSTLQSGLWVESQQRYEQLVAGDRFTLTRAFGRAGWRTVSDVPANTRDWPEGSSFYHFDQLYDARNVGYRGPEFSYATMPDQYTLAALNRLELARTDRAPVMAEVDLVSSHHPWTPLPHLVDWSDVGDGSVFDAMPQQGASPETVFRDPDRVRSVYGQSIEYSLESLISFVQTHPDPDLVLVVLGDHQPHGYVTGQGAGHDVPVSIIAHDPRVMDRISGWGWQAGLRPRPDAPVTRMDTFRDRFLAAYGPQ